MILEKKASLRPLIESQGGVHLTAYIVNRGDLKLITQQIEGAIAKAQREISAAMSDQECRMFLAPLRLLIGNTQLLKRFKHNIAIFRTARVFRLLSIPTEVEGGCVVATTFHVKPLLHWMRVDKDFLLLGLQKKAAYLYFGNRHSLRLIDILKVPPAFSTAELSEWIKSHTKLSRPALFFAGEKSVATALKRRLPQLKVMSELIADSFLKRRVAALAMEARVHMELAAEIELEQWITEFQFAELQKVARRNIFEIAEAVAQGRVRKLMVADGVKIFGKFDSKSGDLKIHARDLDFEDDDVLDDLAQNVMAHGGEVIVASKNEIPEGHLAWAILEPDSRPPEQFLTLDKRREGVGATL